MTTASVPLIAVGAVIFKQNKVLLVKRKNPPAQGMWAIPGGKVQWGETLKQALQREIKEELNIDIEPGRLIKVIEFVPEQENDRFHYIILDFLAAITGGELKAGDDALAVKWFDRKELKNSPVTESTRTLLKEEFDF